MPNGKIYQRSIFARYFDQDDAQAVAWADNVFTKLVEKGLVANYISRDNVEDYEAIYRPAALFFAYLVRLAREFAGFKDDQFLSSQYIDGRGVFVCGDESLDQLLYIIRNTLREFSKRGTVSSYRLPDDNTPQGEILRLLCWDEFTFFKLGVSRPSHSSFNVGGNSPLFRGCTGRYDLNIGYEDSENVYSLSSYPIYNPQYVSLDQYRGRECIHIQGVPWMDESGIKGTNEDKRIVIDPNFNYEITFHVAQDITVENLTFGVIGFNRSGQQVGFHNIVTGQGSNFFFETRRLNKPGSFYFIRGIIFNKDHELLSSSEGRLNIGFGNHLRFTEDVVSIVPVILMDNNPFDDSDFESDTFDSDSVSFDTGDSGTDESGSWIDPSYDSNPSIYLWNIKVTPCSTPYSRCFLNNKTFIDVFVVNNSRRYSDLQINSIFRKYFIPYNTAFKIIYSGEVGEELSYLLLEDGGRMLLEDGQPILLEQ